MTQPQAIHTSVINHPVQVYLLRPSLEEGRYGSMTITLYEKMMGIQCASSSYTLKITIPYTAIRGMFLSVSLTGKFPHQAEIHCQYKNQWYCFMIMERPGDQGDFLKLRQLLAQLIPDPKFAHFHKRSFVAFDIHTVEVAQQSITGDWTTHPQNMRIMLMPYYLVVVPGNKDKIALIPIEKIRKVRLIANTRRAFKRIVQIETHDDNLFNYMSINGIDVIEFARSIAFTVAENQSRKVEDVYQYVPARKDKDKN